MGLHTPSSLGLQAEGANVAMIKVHHNRSEERAK